MPTVEFNSLVSVIQSCCFGLRHFRFYWAINSRKQLVKRKGPDHTMKCHNFIIPHNFIIITIFSQDTELAAVWWQQLLIIKFFFFFFFWIRLKVKVKVEQIQLSFLNGFFVSIEGKWNSLCSLALAWFYLPQQQIWLQMTIICSWHSASISHKETSTWSALSLA